MSLQFCRGSYFPLTTSILLSVILSIILSFFRK
ncbi:MAG: DUF2905 family protein [Candidatus Portnoybacteria bacterium]|nr:DUF2905 family protein [Candidatus Portnoybacteria bacterium]